MALLGIVGDGVSWFLFWPAFSFGVAAVAYARVRSDVFGKRADGKLRAGHVVVLLPYLGLTWMTWWLARAFDRSPAWARLTDSVYIGRRPLPTDVPTGVRSIVDLTCEFAERREVMRNRVYLLRPVLDATALTADELRTIAAEIQGLPAPVYVHCAQGHGRTGMVAAAVLLESGRADTVETALAQVRAVRPGARPNAAQVRALQQMLDRRGLGLPRN
jgi:protein-tyrosine phosphatase